MCEIKNISKGTLITKKAQKADSFYKKVLGLLNPNSSRFLIINTRFGIHTFLLKSPIDVIVVSKNNKVVKVKSNLKPNNLFFNHPRYNTVIEMPKGTINKCHIERNDKISIT